ncbi:SubName: Full=Uncharacterized protein {ECO:0000313/EMBL:CCA71506.1} [Serendipita indica DSM 11827]|nr:SubName: Full=Uncharacterized protein {ECO:0000313/EMBL:CCA71506.1} [Serendipita indica DSM 11827]
MSDSTGFGTGGNSDLLLVGDGTTGTQCNTTDPSADLSVQFASTLQQCGQYTFSGYSNASERVKIQGLIPVGSTFDLVPPENSSSFNWTVNIASGTRVLFFIQDDDGKLSKTSPILNVGGNGNSSCIDDDSPHSTVSSATQEPTSPTATSSPMPTGGSPSDNNGAIIGGAVGGAVLFLILIGILVFFLMRRSRRSLKKYNKRRARDGPDGMRAVDLAPSTPNLHTENHQLPPMAFEPEPFILPPPGSSSGGRNDAPLSPTSHTSTSHQPSSGNRTSAQPPPGAFGHIRSPSQGTALTAASAKAAMAGTSTQGAAPRRFVLHTDAGSVDNLNSSTVELPPTYNAAAGQVAPASDAPNLYPGSQNDTTPSSGVGGHSPSAENEANRNTSSSHLTAPHT